MRFLLRLLFFVILLLLSSIALLAGWHRFGPAPEEVATKLYELDRRITDHQGIVREVAFSSDGALLASGAVDGSAIVRRANDGIIIHRLAHPAPGVTGIDLSADGRYLATGAYDGAVRLWDLSDGTLSKTLPGRGETVWVVEFTPDGRFLASAGTGGAVDVWDIERETLLRTLRGHRGIVWAVAFSPDGRTLASGGYDFTIRLWDRESGRERRVIDDHEDTVVALDYTPDGRLVSGSDDRTARLWDAEGNVIRIFEGSAEHVQAVAISPDGRWLATAGRDKSTLGELAQNLFGDSRANPGVPMRLWDLESGAMVQTFREHADDVNDLAFSPRGEWLASASSDGTIGLWRRYSARQ